MKIINIENFDKAKKIFSGIENGKKARKKFRIGKLDKEEDMVVISIPCWFYSINSSFFSGMFETSLKNLGEKKFREKYIFICDDIIKMNIENGIFNILHS